LFTYDNNALDPAKFDSAGILGPGSVFSDENLQTDLFFQRETTQGSDSYTASSRTDAGFVMFDNKVSNRLRFIWGVRVERFNQKINSESIGKKVAVDKTVTDWLPSINAIYELTEKQNLRVGYARTLSRPEFREFAPLAFYEVNYNSIIIGNESLVRATIDNIDIKWEYYPTPGQTISVNPFYKKFTNPVEMIVIPNPSFRNFSYQNATSAENFGVEFETRILLAGLDKITGTNVFKDFTFYGNLSLIQSQVNLSNSGAGLSRRPLQGQSPYVFNLGLNYVNPKLVDVSFNLNRVGRRIAFVGTSENQTIWENPRTVADLSINRTFFKKLQVKLIVGDIFAQNLIFYHDLNRNGKFDQGTDADAFNYRFGRTLTIGASYTF
jgi:outer membrane receptor for ferrienterochelin and colicin